MITYIGLMLAAYAVARLVQEPVREWRDFGQFSWTVVSASGAGILAVLLCVIGLLVSNVQMATAFSGLGQ